MAEGRKTGGRQRGTPNKKTAELVARVTAEGITPLDVMLRVMREAWEAAGLAADQGQRDQLLALACERAKDAAPYVHPRLVSQDIKADVATTYMARGPEVSENDEAWHTQHSPTLQ